MAFDFKDKPSREPLPVGVYDAVCLGVWDLGTHDDTRPTAKPGAYSHRLMLAFYLKAGVTLQKEYAMSIYKNPKTGIKSGLATDMDSWFFPKSVFDEEGRARPIDPNKLLGLHCQVRLAHNAKGYEKIESIHPPQDKGWECPLPFTVYEVGSTADFPKEMPNYVVTKIKSCHEMQGDSREPQSGGAQQCDSAADKDVPF